MLRANVDTLWGRQQRVIRGPEDAEHAALELALLDAAEWPYPPVYSGLIRYQRENSRGHAEDWKSADRLIRDRNGDCEDLAAARVGELIASGIDPDARPVVYRPRPGLMHVIVSRGDGSYEDPSAALGMGNMSKVLFKSRRLRKGAYEVGVGVPYAGTCLAASAEGVSRADAARQALANVSDLLADFGAWEQLIDYGYKPPYALETDEVGAVATDAEFEAWARSTRDSVESLRREYGEVAARITNAFERVDWSGDPAAIQQQFADAVAAAVATFGGPVGAIAGAVLSAITRFGQWLTSGWPATAIMPWQFAYTDSARKLGFSSSDPKQDTWDMVKAGWVPFDFRWFTAPILVIEDQNYPDEELKARVLLVPKSPEIKRRPTPARGYWIEGEPHSEATYKRGAMWDLAGERYRQLRDRDAIRFFPVAGEAGAETDGGAIRLDALPGDMLDQLALFTPLWLAGNGWRADSPFAKEVKSRKLPYFPPDAAVHKVLRGIFGDSFNSSGGGQGFAGLQPTLYAKVVADLRPGARPLAGYPELPPADSAAPAAGGRQLQLAARPSGAGTGLRATGGRGPRLAPGPSAAAEQRARVPEAPPDLSPDTADRVAILSRIAAVAATGDREALRRIIKSHSTYARFARELMRG